MSQLPKSLWFSLVAVLIFAGCSVDRTLDSLIPRNSLAVVLVEHPALAVQVLGSDGTFPLKSLDTGKPWAAAAVPANPPGFLIAVALADKPEAWPQLIQWARERGGLTAGRVGAYALLSSPGIPEPGLLDPDSRFDLARVRAGGDPVAVYLDVKNIMDEADFPDALRPAFGVLPWAEKNLSGVRLGFAPKDGGLEVRLASDWKEGSEGAGWFRGWNVPADPAAWLGFLPASGGGGVVSLPMTTWASLGASLDPALARRWKALVPFVGPKLAASVSPASEGAWNWALAVESQDPQAVRQAFKTLVAGGDLQQSFPRWALDPDTPLIYQDTSDRVGGVRARVTLGPAEFQIGYGTDRVVVAGGPGVSTTLDRWQRPGGAPVPWTSQVPSGASLVGTGAVDGLGARFAGRVLADGNIELRLWVDKAGLKAWEERLPQALMGWLSGEGGWTRWEP